MEEKRKQLIQKATDLACQLIIETNDFFNGADEKQLENLNRRLDEMKKLYDEHLFGL